MQAGLSGSQFFDQHLDPIDRELIRDRRRYPFVLLDLFDELGALVAHGQFPPLKGEQSTRPSFVRARGHGSKLGRRQIQIRTLIPGTT
jgi:hypothetical protein